MTGVLCYFKIISVKKLWKGKFFYSGTFPRNICECIRRELLNFFICLCFIIHSPQRESRWGLNENSVPTTVSVHLSQFYFFRFPHTCNFPLLYWILLYGFCTLLDILFVKGIYDKFHWQFPWCYNMCIQARFEWCFMGKMGKGICPMAAFWKKHSLGERGGDSCQYCDQWRVGRAVCRANMSVSISFQ